jgi:hypothetical protein
MNSNKETFTCIRLALLIQKFETIDKKNRKADELRHWGHLESKGGAVTALTDEMHRNASLYNTSLLKPTRVLKAPSLRDGMTSDKVAINL